ncbi:hypothetical protein [Piscibacillus halophilus]|uniref:hypothetical protein n=1 Tax=Piscibacillus halophilus TaxID=571933 RepID=UPI00158D9E99|nr:hypothetical protein [Piscibacillus halophilus]
MSQKVKVIFISSLVLNALLITIIIWGYSRANNATDVMFSHDVSHQLIKLEGAIAEQEDDNWENPDLVASQLQVAKQGLWSSFNTAKNLHKVSNKEEKLLNKLYILLEHGFPSELNEVTSEERESLEDLRLALRDAGFGMSIQIGGDKETFIQNAEKLLKNLEESRVQNTEG